MKSAPGGWYGDHGGRCGRAVFRPSGPGPAFEEAVARLKGRKTLRLRGKETFLVAYVNDLDVVETVAVRYRETDILTFRRDGTTVIANGGFNTPTTRTKLQEYMPGLHAWSQENVTHVSFSTEHGFDAPSRYALPLTKNEPLILWPDGGLGAEGDTHVEVVARQVRVREEALEAAKNPPPRKPARRVHGALPGQLAFKLPPAETVPRSMLRWRRQFEQQRILHEIAS